MTSTSGSITSPLANGTYRHLYLAQISALTGTGVMTVGAARLPARQRQRWCRAWYSAEPADRSVCPDLALVRSLRSPAAAAPGAGGARSPACVHGAAATVRRCRLAGVHADFHDQRLLGRLHAAVPGDDPGRPTGRGTNIPGRSRSHGSPTTCSSCSHRRSPVCCSGSCHWAPCSPSPAGVPDLCGTGALDGRDRHASSALAGMRPARRP
jgi:hypothetical protein